MKISNRRCDKVFTPSRFPTFLDVCHISVFQNIKAIWILVKYNNAVIKLMYYYYYYYLSRASV